MVGVHQRPQHSHEERQADNDDKGAQEQQGKNVAACIRAAVLFADNRRAGISNPTGCLEISIKPLP